MFQFNSILLATGAVFLASQTEAKNIHNSCLELSDDMEGHDGGEFMTNEDQLTQYGMDDTMRLHSFTTCMNDSDEVTGIQLTLAIDPYSDTFTQPYPLNPIGHMVGECQTVVTTGPLDEIKAAGGDDGVTGIKYYLGDDELKYGDVPKLKWKNTKWEFDDNMPLIGLYGRQTETGITQLGLITLDTVCQITADEILPPEPIVEETVIDT